MRQSDGNWPPRTKMRFFNAKDTEVSAEERRAGTSLRPLRKPLQCNPPTSRNSAKVLPGAFFFLFPRRRGGERTEERGIAVASSQTRLLSPDLPMNRPVAQTFLSAVAQVSNLLGVGIVEVCGELRATCRLEIGDTAGWKPALPRGSGAGRRLGCGSAALRPLRLSKRSARLVAALPRCAFATLR